MDRSQWPLVDNTHNNQKSYIHASGGIQTRNPNKRAAALDRAAN
jgi:hypothetical protein